MALFVASDLHLDEPGQARLFDDDRQGPVFARLCESIGPKDELILLGDVFDFTAMTPPRQGLERFFETMRVPMVPPPRRSLPELCAAVAASNPVALGALARLSKRTQVTLVPGNHDRQLGEPGAQEALEAIGLRVTLAPHVVRQVGQSTVVLLHGHELDRSNRGAEGSGEVMTHALHHAVIPFLRHHGARANVRMDPDRVVALRPEENVLSVLQRWLDPETFETLFHALLRLLAENGLLPRHVSWLTALISADRVRRRAERADRLWERAGDTAIQVLRGTRALPHALPQPDLLVLGHTHVLDWAVDGEGGRASRLYVNLGTWTARAFDAFSPADTTLPVLEVASGDGALLATLSDLREGRVMQQFSRSAAPRPVDDALPVRV